MKNVFSNTKCKYEAYDKNEVDTLLSNIYTKGDFAIISGSLTIAASSSGAANISYPTGFTQNNCVPITFGVDVESTWGINYFGEYADSSDILRNSYSRSINFKEEEICATIKNPTTSEKKVNYNIVLMKIGTGD